MPTVSICIPTYNQTFFLKKTLDSIFIQDFNDFEIIISDDSTNDKVQELLNNYPADKIKYFKNMPSLGSPKNWNHSMDMANGKYIKILHHDDWFTSSTSLSKFIAAIESNKNIDLVFCNSNIYNDRTKQTTQRFQNREIVEKQLKNKEVLLTKNIIGAPSAILVKKSCLRFDEMLIWLVDIEFYLKLLNKNNFVFIEESLICTTDKADHQITNSCKNIETEFGEWFYLFNKYRKGLFRCGEIKYLFKKIYKYRVSSILEIQTVCPSIPNKIFVRFIIMLSEAIKKIYEKNY